MKISRMKINGCVIAVLAGIAAAAAHAQSAPQPQPQPLNLNLPPDPTPVERATTAPEPASQGNSSAASTATDASIPPGNAAQLQPGVPYEGPGGMYGNPEGYVAHRCDDAAYRQPQVHGEVSAGVIGGDHASGNYNYQSGVLHASKAFGSCDNPTGGVGISIGVGHENLNGRHHWWH